MKQEQIAEMVSLIHAMRQCDKIAEKDRDFKGRFEWVAKHFPEIREHEVEIEYYYHQMYID